MSTIATGVQTGQRFLDVCWVLLALWFTAKIVASVSPGTQASALAEAIQGGCLVVFVG
jgi:hypothetical protein